MPASTPQERVPPPGPPALVLSGPDEDVKVTPPTKSALASRRRSKTESSALKASSVRSKASAEWIDVDDSPRRRKKTSSKHPSSRTKSVSSGSSSSSSRSRSRSSTESEVVVGRFQPKLSRISESTDSRSTSRPSTSGSSESRKHREKSSAHRSSRHRDDLSVASSRRPTKHRTGGVSRRVPDSGFKANPSLLSVLSTLTGASDKSSSSNTTITQDSYDRKRGIVSRVPADRREPVTEVNSKYPAAAQNPPEPNVFDYLEESSMDDGHDGRSTYSTSSSTSHYDNSDAGSSELPDTPSSRSTFPSPTSTRNSSLSGSGSVAELRRKYDAQSTTSTAPSLSARSSSYSPEFTVRGLKKLAQVRSVPEEDHEDEEPQTAPQPPVAFVSNEHERERSSSVSSRSSRRSQRSEDRLQYQEEAVRHHLALAQQQHGPHMGHPAHLQHRSPSASSHDSSHSAQSYNPYTAVQQYHYPLPPAPPGHPVPPQAINGHPISHPERPVVPDPPDFSQRTIAGYEQLALELSNNQSSVKPLYRKFDYLNHRILLHLQDELAEMEEQLRIIDEIIAQMEQPLSAEEPRRPPASRRVDAFRGTEYHYRRRDLLGRIFLKTELYNRAMASYATLNKEALPAESEQISSYQEWLKENSPIHEIETRFLQNGGDLIVPGKGKEKIVVSSPADSRPTTIYPAPLTCLPVALMLPLLLFALIPTLSGRLVVTALIAVGACMVAAQTRVRHLMEVNEWIVCGGAYVVIMAAIAGCIPQHAS